jgi:hypothetical protein
VNASQTGLQSQTSTGVWNGRTITAGSGISVSNGDGISGNPTITASPAPGGLSTVLVYDDFLGDNGNTNYSNPVGNSALPGSVGGGGGTVTSPTAVATNPGVVSLNATGSNEVSILGPHYGIVAGGGTITIQWLCKLPVLSDATNRYTARIGLTNLFATTSDPTKGCWFQYVDNVNSGNWQIKSAGAATTTANTSTAADTNWNNFKIVINAGNTSVSFYINNVEVANSPIATNLPNAVFGQQVSIVRGANAGGSIYVDMYILQIDLTAARPG